jgi:polyhydroxybutyrate depolymerase
MSNGGDLSYRLACEADDLVRAVIPVAGCLMGVIAESCAPTRPVPLLEIHGTDDPITLWGGDPDGDDGWGVYLGAEASVGHFVDHYGHTDYAEEAVPDREADGRTARRRRWTGGPSGVEVQLLQIDGGGHDWPGAFGPHDVDAAAEVWAFAQAAP